MGLPGPLCSDTIGRKKHKTSNCISEPPCAYRRSQSTSTPEYFLRFFAAIPQSVVNNCEPSF